jgi:hypothetical protein
VGESKFEQDYVDHGDGNALVPGTNIRRLRRVPLGPKAGGYFDDELAQLIEALRQLRNSTPPQPRPEPEHLKAGRDAYYKRLHRKRAKLERNKTRRETAARLPAGS